MPKIGIQLYTVRDYLAKDYLGATSAVCKMGYEGVELPSGAIENVKASALRALLDEHSAELIGIVFLHQDFEERMDDIAAYCEQAGCKRVIYPYIPDELRRTEQELIDVAKLMDSFGETLRKKGLEFFYHTHGYEFTKYGHRTGMDILHECFNTKNVQLEIDVYWVEHGGEDSVRFMRRHGARSPLIHFKDSKDRQSWKDAEVGAGCLDMNEIARTGINHDALWFIVEQEQYDADSMESAAISLKNLRGIVAGLNQTKQREI
jgi:sugar phosphate isomerase/epimerase